MANIEIRTSDPRMAAGIAEGANAVALQALRSEYDKLRAVNGVRRQADEKRWKRTQRRLARKYSVKPVGRVEGAILGAWALLWLGIDGAYRYLSAWNREG